MNFNTLDTFNSIFVVGNSRSGTTLIARILGRHSRVFTFNELHFFEELWHPSIAPADFSFREAVQLLARLFNIQRNGYLTQKNSNNFIQEAEKIVKNLPEIVSPPSVFKAFLQYESCLHHKTISCEHTPRNVLYIGDILEHFPEGRIVNIIRDPRDVLLSQKRRWRRPFFDENIPVKETVRYWIDYHSITISQLWNANIRAAEKFKGDRRVYSLRFEDLLSAPEEIALQICSFIGISFDRAMLAVPQIGSSSEPDRVDRTGINQERARGWRRGGLNSTEIFICQKINHTLMDKHGYELESLSPNPILLLSTFFTFPVKLIFAIFLNLKRMPGMTRALKKRLNP